jgi:branched-chain amino acid transport system permease protein
MRIMSKAELVCFVILATAVIAGPSLASGGFLLTLLGYTFAFAIFAMSVYVVLGWIGEIPLGHSLYYGLGAYGSGILMKEQGFGFLPATLITSVLVLVLATVIGLITLRLSGAYFAIVSWGLASVAVVVANSAESLTGGALGLLGVPIAEVGPLSLSDSAQYAWVAGTLLLLVVAGLAALRRTPFGRRVNGGRVNDHLVRAAGADIYRDRVLAFALSALLASVSGALSVSYLRVVTPGILGVSVTVEALVMVLLGGSAFLLGPVVGAAFFRIVPEQIHLEAEVRTIVVAALILGIVMLAPGGVPDILRRIGSRFRSNRISPPSLDPPLPDTAPAQHTTDGTKV